MHIIPSRHKVIIAHNIVATLYYCSILGKRIYNVRLWCSLVLHRIKNLCYGKRIVFGYKKNNYYYCFLFFTLPQCLQMSTKSLRKRHRGVRSLKNLWRLKCSRYWNMRWNSIHSLSLRFHFASKNDLWQSI